MFYLLRTEKLSEYDFEYLNYNSSTKRMEDTKIHGKKIKEPKPALVTKEKYCIEYMTKKVISIDLDATVDQAYKTMLNNEVRHLPVTKDGLFCGLVSIKDLLPLITKPFHEKIKIAEKMSKVVICCSEETPLKYVAHVMVNEKISCLVVVDENRQLRGIISYIDVLKYLVNS